MAGTDRHPESPQIPDSPAGFPGQGEVLRNVTVVRCPHVAAPSDATYVGKGQPASHIISTMTSSTSTSSETIPGTAIPFMRIR